MTTGAVNQQPGTIIDPVCGMDVTPGDAAGGSAPKAWRFVGEMEEIAATFAAAGLPDGFHLAAAEVWRRLSSYKDAPRPSVEDVVQLLAKTRH